MIEQGAPGPEDVIPILLHLLNSLQALQAPARTSTTQRWREAFSALVFCGEGRVTDTDKDASSSSYRPRNWWCTRMVPALPLFFEFCACSLEEVEADVSEI